MNAERLHAIAFVLNGEMESTDIVTKVDDLCEALDAVVNENDSAAQETLAKALQEVYASLVNAGTDNFSPAWRQMLLEIGGVNLFGQALKSTIENIFQKNQITPAVALTELRALHGDLESFETALEQLIAAYKKFGIGNEQLAPGECEIGMLIPRQAVENRLTEFAIELKDISFILNTFSEVATGKIDDLTIKTISSSDLSVYLKAAVPFAACLAVGMERTIALYKQLLEVKKLRGELLKQGVPEKQTATISEYANTMMEKGIEVLSNEIVERFYTGKDTGRKNELITAVRISLRSIANRVDRGYNIEVRAEPLKKEADGKTSHADTNAANIQLIRAASKKMQFMKLEGEPILQLPEAVQKPITIKPKTQRRKFAIPKASEVKAQAKQ